MTLDTIVNIPGNLRSYKQLVPGTFYTARQLMDERCAPVDTAERRQLRGEWHYAADGHIYTVEKDKVEWSITDEKNNLVLQNLETAFIELTQNGNYRPSNEASQAARLATSTLRVDMSSLRLSGDDNEWRYLTIETATGSVRSGEEYVAPNDTERAVLDRLGYTAANLVELQKARISETRIRVSNPAYVKNTVAPDPKKRDSVARASWLNDFDGNSLFNAFGRGIDGYYRVRGVRKKSSDDFISAPESDNLSDSGRREIVAGDAPENTKAVGLLSRLKDYFQAKIRP